MKPDSLHYETVTPLLQNVLRKIMACPLFEPFRLVGGTALSLQCGHRVSDDIDLFSEAEFGTLDFKAMQDWLYAQFPYCAGNCGEPVGFGTSYIVGTDRNNNVKVDLFYTDPFIRPIVQKDGIRLTDLTDIITMKLEVISSGGRKKDFWDLHELHEHYTLPQMLDWYEERNPYTANRAQTIARLTDFSRADTEVDPRCLKNKVWQLIKLDISEWAQTELKQIDSLN